MTGGVCIQGVCIQGCLHLEGLHPGGLRPGGSASGGVFIHGVCIQGGCPRALWDVVNKWGGMHPTGMHSCLNQYVDSNQNCVIYFQSQTWLRKMDIF